MAHLHSVYDGDTHFKIDAFTRAITNTTDKSHVVQLDHKSERFTFDLPRYIDGHDMSLCNEVSVHYINIGADNNQVKDVYFADDFAISPDDETVVICSWLISANATQLAGSLNFLIRFACVADDGTIEYAWHTDIHTDIKVKDGMNNGEAVVAEYSDVLEAWKAEIMADFSIDFEAEKNAAVAEIEAAAREALDSIPEDYANLIVQTTGGSSNQVMSQKAVTDALAKLSGNGGGLTATASVLLTTILRNAVFVADQAANITSLETELAKTNSGTGGGDTGGGDDTGDDTGGGEVITYTITNNLTDVSTNNTTKSITANSAYGATLKAKDGLYIGEVTVTMGGVDVTNTAYSNGSILITAVTGDVVITATATEWETVRVLYSDDLQYKTATHWYMPSSNPPYTSPQNNRTGYYYDDIKAEGGYIYKFDFVSTVSTLEIGITGITEAGANLMSTGGSIIDGTHSFVLSVGVWRSSGYEAEMPYQHKGSPVDHIRFAFRMSANNEEFEDGCISSVTISRKAVA